MGAIEQTNERIEQASMAEAVDRAVAWWHRQLSAGALGSSGDAKIDMALALNRVRAKPHVVDAFCALLRTSLSARLSALPGSRWGVDLRVEYAPDDVLLQIASQSGLPCAAFPIKTRMHVSKDLVVAHCYDAQAEVLWRAERDGAGER